MLVRAKADASSGERSRAFCSEVDDRIRTTHEIVDASSAMSPWTNDGAADRGDHRDWQDAGVGEEVEGNDLVRRMVVEHVPDIGGPDESRASGDDDAHPRYAS